MSETEVVNLGLARAKIKARITNLATDTTSEAKAARDCFARMRNALLRKYLWSFAKMRVELAQLSTAPAFGKTYAYALPSDFVRTISVHPADSDYASVVYKMESITISGSPVRVIVADAPRLWLRYVGRQVLTGVWDELFVECFSWALAQHFALVIKESTADADYCAGEFRKALGEARAANSIEDWPDKMPDGSWSDSRDAEGGDWAHNNSWAQ